MAASDWKGGLEYRHTSGEVRIPFQRPKMRLLRRVVGKCKIPVGVNLISGLGLRARNLNPIAGSDAQAERVGSGYHDIGL